MNLLTHHMKQHINHFKAIIIRKVYISKSRYKLLTFLIIHLMKWSKPYGFIGKTNSSLT